MLTYGLGDEAELRLLQLHHAQALFDLTQANRAHLREWLPWVDGVKTTEDTQNFIRGTLLQLSKDSSLNLGIWYRGQLAGTLGTHSINWTNRKTEIGYWLGEAFIGKGLMTTAVRALADYLFFELNLNRLEIRAATGNRKSCAIPERLGFRLVGVAKDAEWLYDHFVDHAIYEMLARDWQKTSA
jgi:ribosomal-protein-serine acetyltransferase